jgi:7,8-dihydropterin-6-yl-methyl-4-(beta-D-ribofuranosyl)aminobenzene 5'-phosphate synthase
VLSENIAKPGFLAEHGLSYLIEIDEEQLIFDTGSSYLFLKNAAKNGLNLDSVNKVVLSHGHWDHSNGLQFLKDKTLITHPKAFQKRYRTKVKENIGISLTYAELKERFKIIESKGPYQISKNLFYLGEIPRINSFESQSTPFILENGNPDYIEDDSALAAIVDKELIIITGCSHSGICNICDYAMEITGIDKIRTVIGGFHLKKLNTQTLKTIDYFKNNEIKEVLPSHCTSFSLLPYFNEKLVKPRVSAGSVFEF